MKKPAVIFDIDGTLANCDHRLHLLPKGKKDVSKQWDRFFEAMDKDGLNEDVYALYMAVNNYVFPSKDDFYSYEKIIITGRPIRYCSKTFEWLRVHNIYPEEIYFRENEDHRGDHIIKKEFYEKHIKDRYDVKFVVEDRQRVVDMWRSLGLTCLQCAKGDF